VELCGGGEDRQEPLDKDHAGGFGRCGVFDLINELRQQLKLVLYFRSSCNM